MEVKSFTYNKSFSYSVTIGLSLLIMLFILRSYQLEDPSEIRILKYIGLLFFIILGLVILRFLIPSINQYPALELNDLSLVDKVRNREVNWENVKGIRLINFPNGGAGVCIDLLNKDLFRSNLNTGQKFLGWISNLTYGTPFVIPLQYISGLNQEIFETLQFFLNKTITAPNNM